MRYPEILFTPSDYEVAKQIVAPGRLAMDNSASGALTILFCDFGPVPQDRVLILSAAEGHTTAGAAQTTSVIRITTLRGDGQTAGPRELLRRFPGAQLGSADFSGEVHLMPGEVVRIQADFSAGAASNSLFTSLFGILVPRATYQYSEMNRAAGGS